MVARTLDPSTAVVADDVALLGDVGNDHRVELDGTGRTSREILEVIGAAREGRAGVVFASGERHVWGTASSDGDVEIR